MEYSNVKGVIGLCIRDGHVRNQEELFDIIKEKNLYDCELAQYDDPDSDYIWCVFYEGTIDLDEDSIKNIVDYIIDNDEERYW